MSAGGGDGLHRSIAGAGWHEALMVWNGTVGRVRRVAAGARSDACASGGRGGLEDLLEPPEVGPVGAAHGGLQQRRRDPREPRGLSSVS